MFSKAEWDGQVEIANDRLFDLYWNEHQISLEYLQEFRKLLRDIDRTMQILLNKESKALFSKRAHIQKEKAALNNIFQTLGYNLIAA